MPIFITKVLRRNGNGVKWMPATIQPCCDSSERNAVNFHPLANQFGFAVNTQRSIATFVSMLLLVCRPTAIRVFIVSVLVRITIQRVIWHWLAHVGVKIFKFLPAFTNVNSASAIIRVLRVVRIPTSVEHFLPNVINSSTRHAMRSGRNASAGFSAVLRSQVCRTYIRDCTASALTTPQYRSVFGVTGSCIATNGFKYGQKSKVLARQVNYKGTQLVRNLIWGKVNIGHQYLLERFGVKRLRSVVAFRSLIVCLV